FAPIANLGLIVIWDDGDDLYAEPRAPYPHTRDILCLRSHQARTSLLLAGYARSVEAQLLVESGWAHDIVAERDQIRRASPRVIAVGDNYQLARDPAAQSARLPAVALETAQAALALGRPVLIQVPRGGYAPVLSCAACRVPARCVSCQGPLEAPS